MVVILGLVKSISKMVEILGLVESLSKMVEILRIKGRDTTAVVSSLGKGIAKE